MKFRIKHVEGVGYFPQVKQYYGLFNIFGWQKIARHPSNTFGLYDEDNHKYPKETEEEALKVIEDYKKSFVPKKITYITVQEDNL